jgi:adenylate cyclase class IV
LITINKEREVYNFGNEFEISFDKVKGLGYFVEIEAKKDFGGVKKNEGKDFRVYKKIKTQFC